MRGEDLVQIILAGAIMTTSALPAEGEPPPRGPLDPRGRIHIPIGLANTVDTLKTFVEAEGCFSPGVGSCGVYFWLYDPQTGKLTAPTSQGVTCARGLEGGGFLIPWSQWQGGDVQVRTEVCQVLRKSPAGDVHVVAVRATLTNTGGGERKVALFVALRGMGPAGRPVEKLSVADDGAALLVDDHPALVAAEKPSAVGVADTDTAGELAKEGKTPPNTKARSASGDCSGAMRFDVAIGPSKKVTLGFICPVLPGRRAVGHKWDGTSAWAQLDLSKPNPAEGGVLQGDPGLEFYRSLKVDELFAAAGEYWKDLVGRFGVRTPDPRWTECLRAIVGHASLAMNEGAPDVAVVNYNVFNRDGVYTANILQKAGRLELAASAIDYFLAHPFNGRVQCEADNPGQVLWIMGQQWLFTRDKEWLARVQPSASRIAAMIRYYRKAPPPHYVKATSLDFGDALPADKPDDKPAARRQVLKPGSCDGHHPEYTEAFDIAGLRAAAMLAQAAGKDAEAAEWSKLADSLMRSYEQDFGDKLPAGYGSYSVLWPCRLYSLSEGKAHEQFKGKGAQKPTGWRYFPLATAHQGLLAGNRAAGHGTLQQHLDHEQVRGWYAFDEGGGSGPGGWKHLRTTWNPSVAMPHGWAIAELWLLMRDCLLFEDQDRLVLLGGVPERWFTDPNGIVVQDLSTHFGPCSFSWKPLRTGAVLALSGKARPDGGFALRLPESIQAKATSAGKALQRTRNGDVLIPRDAAEVHLEFAGGE